MQTVPPSHLPSTLQATTEGHAARGRFGARSRRVTWRGDPLPDRRDRASKLLVKHLQTELARLDKQEENLIDLAADGGQAVAKVKMRLADIQHERARIAGRLDDGVEALAVAAHLVDQALRLLDNPQNLYRSLSPEQRRYMNDSIFERIYVHDGEVDDAVFKPPFDSLIRARDEIRKYSGGDASAPTAGMKKRRPDVSQLGPVATVYFDGGSSKGLLAGAWASDKTLRPGSSPASREA